MGFQKLKLLGAGSNGSVFLSQSYFPCSKPFAVKSSSLDSSDSLRVEASILSQLRGCPYIIQGFGHDNSVEHKKRVFNLLLEYAPGGTLQRLVRSQGGFIPEYEVSFYAYQLLKGIHDVHRRGFVHCDLKPDNVLMFPSKNGVNHIKIADFGLSKVAGKDIFGNCHRGALLYTSPESLFCGVHEAPKDIWAIGCMVVEMIAGKSPWRFYNNELITRDMAFNQPEIPMKISDAGKDFLQRCFERNPNLRWTADMLLNHPFIANNYNLQMGKQLEDDFGKNNGGGGGWSSTTGLFSTPPPPPPVSPIGLNQHIRMLKKRVDKIFIKVMAIQKVLRT